MSTFTPGPWNIHPSYPLDAPVRTTTSEPHDIPPFDYWHGTIAAGEIIIGETHMQSATPNLGWPHVTDVEEAKANTHLMVAAPTMHAAIIEAIKLLGSYDFIDERAAAVLTQLREALAASEGRVIG